MQRDHDGARAQARDRRGAEPSGDVGLDQPGGLVVDLDRIKVDVVEAVVLGERSREVVLAEVAVVDEDLREAAARERCLQRRLHRRRCHEPASDDDVRQEAVGQRRPPAAASPPGRGRK